MRTKPAKGGYLARNMKPCSEMLLEVTVYCGKVRDQTPPQREATRSRALREKDQTNSFNFAPIIEKQKMLIGRSAGIRPVLWPGQPLGIRLHGQRLKYLRYN